VVWQQLNPGDPPIVSFYDAGGALLFRAPGQSLRYIEKTPQGNLVQWREANETRVGLVDDSGRVIRSWSWTKGGAGDNLLLVGGQLSENRLYGVVMTPEWFEFGTDSPGITQDELRHGRMFPIEIAVINLDTATIHPLWGPSFDLTGNQNPYAVHIDKGPVRRVTTGGDCLNVRGDPAVSSTSLGCFRDGVLLHLRTETEQNADDIAWVAVESPDGSDGWAAAEFLER
jgi:hypothetical protein